MFTIIGILIGAISFGFLCEGLLRNGVTWCDGIHAKTRYMKNKRIWQYGIFIVVGTIVLIGLSMIGLGDLPQGFILGSLYALISVIFEDSFFDKLRNTLR